MPRGGSCVSARFVKELSLSKAEHDLVHLIYLCRIGYLAWQAIRVVLFALLKILRPIVTVALSCLAIGGLLVTFLYKWTSTDSRFPFWLMLGISMAFAIMLLLYDRVLSCLSRR